LSRLKSSVAKERSTTVAVQQILGLFGPPPLLSTECRERFERILARFVTEVAPAGALFGR
jgi:hypothetical protein